MIEVKENWTSPDYLPHILAEVLPFLKCQLTYSKGWPARATQAHKMARFGDDDVTYSFKGNSKPVHPWPREVMGLRNDVHRELGWMPNCVVVNTYTEDGDLHPHRDSQFIPELGENPTIVSLSFGVTRTMLFYELDAKGKRIIPARGIRLRAGTMLVMSGDADSKYHHAFKPEPESPGLRLSLTFRKHLK